jgi:hypothetical protein
MTGHHRVFAQHHRTKEQGHSMPSHRDSDFRPRAEPARHAARWLVIAVIAVAAGGFAWWQWSRRPEPPTPVVAAPDQPAEPTADPASVVPPSPQNPIDALAKPDAALPALNDSDVQMTAALGELIGSKRMASFLQLDGFVRRVVATVDNLGRSQAAARMWPVQPAPGRFTTAGAAGAATIDAANAGRHEAFVAFVETVDAQRAAALYARLYPLFQEAYEELGYPGRYFNDRLVAVIDHLLQAPEPAAPVAVTLVEVKGEIASSRPWTRYEFVDPALESLSSGQKMMVRVGLANERRLKAKLAAFRARIATGEIASAPR